MISIIRAFQYGMQIIWAQLLRIPYDKNMEVWTMDLTLSTDLDLDLDFIIPGRQLALVTTSNSILVPLI